MQPEDYKNKFSNKELPKKDFPMNVYDSPRKIFPNLKSTHGHSDYPTLLPCRSSCLNIYFPQTCFLVPNHSLLYCHHIFDFQRNILRALEFKRCPLHRRDNQKLPIKCHPHQQEFSFIRSLNQNDVQPQSSRVRGYDSDKSSTSPRIYTDLADIKVRTNMIQASSLDQDSFMLDSYDDEDDEDDSPWESLGNPGGHEDENETKNELDFWKAAEKIASNLPIVNQRITSLRAPTNPSKPAFLRYPVESPVSIYYDPNENLERNVQGEIMSVLEKSTEKAAKLTRDSDPFDPSNNKHLTRGYRGVRWDDEMDDTKYGSSTSLFRSSSSSSSPSSHVSSGSPGIVRPKTPMLKRSRFRWGDDEEWRDFLSDKALSKSGYRNGVKWNSIPKHSYRPKEPVALTSLRETGFDFSIGKSGRYWLKIINEISKSDQHLVFENLSSLLSHEDLYFKAFDRLKIRMGATDPRRSLSVPKFKVSELIDQVTSRNYQFTRISQQRLDMKTVKKKLPYRTLMKVLTERRTRLPIKDEVIQEVLYMILSSIYEPIFEDSSHAYRNDRNPHTALQLVRTIKPTPWALEGNLSKQFRKLDFRLLKRLLCKKIKDPFLIQLIGKAVSAGNIYFRDQASSLVETPHASPLARVLSNVYMHELDVHMRNMCRDFGSRPSKYTSFERQNDTGVGFLEPIPVSFFENAEKLVQQDQSKKDETEKINREKEDIINRTVRKNTPFPGQEAEEVQELGYFQEIDADPLRHLELLSSTCKKDKNMSDKSVKVEDAESPTDWPDDSFNETEKNSLLGLDQRGIKLKRGIAPDAPMLKHGTQLKASQLLRIQQTVEKELLSRWDCHSKIFDMMAEPLVPIEGYTRVEKDEISRRLRLSIGPKKLAYVRYGAKFAIFVNGSQSDCDEVKDNVEEYLSQELHLFPLPDTIKKRCMIKEGVNFCGTSIRTQIREDGKTISKMLAPGNFLFKKLAHLGYCDRKGNSLPRTKWYHHDKELIVRLYNHTLVTLLNYYAFSDNYLVFQKRLRYTLQSSCAKLLAGKHKLKSRAKVYKKWGQDFGIPGLELKQTHKRKFFSFMEQSFFLKENAFFL